MTVKQIISSKKTKAKIKEIKKDKIKEQRIITKEKTNWKYTRKSPIKRSSWNKRRKIYKI